MIKLPVNQTQSGDQDQIARLVIEDILINISLCSSFTVAQVLLGQGLGNDVGEIAVVDFVKLDQLVSKNCQIIIIICLCPFTDAVQIIGSWGQIHREIQISRFIGESSIYQQRICLFVLNILFLKNNSERSIVIGSLVREQSSIKLGNRNCSVRVLFIQLETVT